MPGSSPGMTAERREAKAHPMSELLIENRERVRILTMNRPDKRNALTRQLISDLKQALEDLRCERLVRAVVLSASGPAFFLYLPVTGTRDNFCAVFRSPHENVFD